MGKEWDFLISEMWLLLALAGLIGLFAGWIIWGGRKSDAAHNKVVAALNASLAEVEQVRREVEAKEAEVAALQAAKAEASRAKAAETRARNAAAKAAAAKAKPAPKRAKAAPQAKAAPKVKAATKTAPRRKAAAKRPAGPAKPIVLKKARRGKADDLTQIKGVGPKLEAAINDLGIYHYDQVAKWSAKEAAWVDENLGGIKGRIARDKWVTQAKGLMNGA